MNDEDDKIMDQMLEEIRHLAEAAKETVKIKTKISEALEGKQFSTQLSAINMVLFEVIAKEADDCIEAAAYVSRICHTLMTLIDKNAVELDEDAGDETLQ